MRRLAPFALSLTAALAISPGPVRATDSGGAVPVLNFPFETFRLDNGLRVVLAENHTTPTVAVVVLYDVGSRNEVPGRTGFAHLFEHMMFQGSADVEKGEHFRYVSSNGGRMNGFTAQDWTVYFEMLPSDRLELGLWLESDRMLSLDVSTENFENQREVVKEERRLRVDNEPYVGAWLAFFEMAYESFEYAHSVIGSMDDLDAAVVSDVQAFFDLYYAPNNAWLVLVGDFDSDRARALVARYFGDIPRAEEPPPVSFVEPEQTERREEVYEDPIATQPMLLMGWHVPPEPDPDHDALRLAAHILGGGESSRLYRRLIRDGDLALDVSASVRGLRGPDLFMVQSTSRGVEPEVLRDAVLEEVARLRDGGATEAEVASAREQLVMRTVYSVEGNLSRAITMGRDALFYGDPGRIGGDIGRIEEVSVDDVNRVVRRYLTDTNVDIMLVRALGAEEEE